MKKKTIIILIAILTLATSNANAGKLSKQEKINQINQAGDKVLTCAAYFAKKYDSLSKRGSSDKTMKVYYNHAMKSSEVVKDLLLLTNKSEKDLEKMLERAVIKLTKQPELLSAPNLEKNCIAINKNPIKELKLTKIIKHK